MKEPGFFGRLFRKGRREETPPLSLESVMARVFTAGLAGRVSGGSEVQPVPVPFDAAEAGIRSCPAGITTSVSTGADECDLIILYPEAYLELAAALLAGDPPGTPQDPLRRVALSTEGNLCRFVALEPPEEPDESGLERPVLERPTLRTWRRFTASDRDELVWRAGHCAAWQVPAGGVCLTVFVPEELKERMSVALGASAGYQAAVRAAVLGEPGVEDRSPPPPVLSVGVRSPSVFPAGALFCPVRVGCAHHVLQTRIESAAVGQQAAAQAPSPGLVWTRASCSVAGKTVLAHYGIDAGTPEKASSMAQALRQLLACQFREVIRSLGGLDPAARPDTPRMAPGARPDTSRAEGYVVLRTVTAVGALRLPCQIWLPIPSVAALCSRALDAWELRQAQLEKPAVLSALLALNQKLLSRGVGRLHVDFLEARAGQERPAAAQAFPFAAFVELAGDRDLRLALQNCVLQHLGTRPLRALFSYADTQAGKDGKALTRQVTPYAVDEARVLRFLPRTHAGQWTGAAFALAERAEYLSANADVMKAIRDAVRRGHLLLSRRGRFILDTMYQPTVQDAARLRLEGLQKARVPFADIEKLDAPRIQELLSRTSARLLCLSLLGSDADMGIVRSHTSKSKFAQLAEDFSILKRQLDEGSLDVEEAVEARQSVAEAARRILEAEAAQEQAAQARSPSPAAGAGSSARAFRSRAEPRARPASSRPAGPPRRRPQADPPR